MRKYVAIIGAMVLTVGTVAAQQEVPKFGGFLGYTYTRFGKSTLAPAFSSHGGNGQFIYNFNGWVSGVIDAGAVNNGNIARFGVDGTFINFLGGPRVNFRRWKTWTPYVQALFGGVHGTTSFAVTGVVIDPAVDTFLPEAARPHCAGCTPDLIVTSRFRSSQTAFALTAGGGLDIRFSKHVSFRPFEVSYYMTRLKPIPNSGNNTQDNLRASAGFTFLFGGEKPAPVQKAQVAPPPQTKTCPNGVVVPMGSPCPKQDLTMSVSANNRELCPGDSTPLVANVSGQGNSPLNWKWTVNGQPMGQSPNFEFSAAGRDPGTYTIAATAAGDMFNPATAETTVTVLEYRPPSGNVSATPARIEAGERSSLSASFSGQCGGPIGAPSFEASEGSIQGDQFDSSSIRWDAGSAAQTRTVTITAKASDNKNVGTATTTIEVNKTAVIAPVRLPDVLFDMNSARVNNCGKRILLEQLRAYSERDSSGTVVLVGHSSSDEHAANIAMQRAMNAAAVITAGTGVCLSIPQSQVQISAPGVDQNGVPFESGFCRGSVRAGSTASELRRVEVWFVPTGGQIPTTAGNTQAASAMSVSSLGCPK